MHLAVERAFLQEERRRVAFKAVYMGEPLTHSFRGIPTEGR